MAVESEDGQRDPSYTDASGVNRLINTITSVNETGVATIVYQRVASVTYTIGTYMNTGGIFGGNEDGGVFQSFTAWVPLATPDTQQFLNEERFQILLFTTTGRLQNQVRTCDGSDGSVGTAADCSVDSLTRTIGAVDSSRTTSNSGRQFRNNVTLNTNFMSTFTTANAEALISFSVGDRGLVSLSVSGTLNNASFADGQNLGRQQDVTIRTLTGDFVVPSGFSNTGGTVPVSISVNQPLATFLVSDLGPGNCGVGQSGVQVFGTFNFGSATYTGSAITANTGCASIVHTLPFTVSGSIPVGFVNATNPFSFDVTCTGNQQSLPEYDSDNITIGCSVSGNGAISLTTSPAGTLLNRSANPSGANNTGSPRTVTVTFDWTGTTPSTFCDAGSSALFTGLTCVATQPVAVACRNISAVSQIGGYTLCDGNTQFLNPVSNNGLGFCYEDGQNNLTYTTICT